MSIIDMTGQKYGKLTVLSFYGRQGKSQHATWKCRCDCGNIKIIVGASIRAKRSLSCGCESKNTRFTSKRMKKHGKSYDRVYKIWQGMIKRCLDSNGQKSHLYFGKGIKVCERWKKFENFYADMGDPAPKMTLDRIDGNGNYEPSNCRWASREVQANNTSSNKKIQFNGQILNAGQWAKKIGIKPNTLIYRLRRGWTVERALTR